ncbi:sulfotransferase [Spirulina subsalsa FACHB-351]|uniref:Sulfotransferase n=1 Tax=Spirulina subsalsa FACHB-351 TaxID=234711 RepID=A0ABT3L489_9CYAN|nr:sulfotransferase [Spirulina subsalsa FACHB-351]
MRDKAKIQIIRQCLNGRFKASDAIILTSSPRSGSTLLSQILSAIPKSCVLFEPLHIGRVPEAEKAGFSWRTYVDPEIDWPEGATFLRRVFEGRVINDWTSCEMSVGIAYNAEKLIVKFVRANRLLPWICNSFTIPAPIFLIRHPCAVIASQIKYGWDNAKYAPESPPYLDIYPSFRSALEQLNSDVEYLAALWALDQLPVLLQNAPTPWIMITYEELCLRPQRTIERISSRLNLNLDLECALANLKTPSSVVSSSGISGVNGWKRQLTREQITKILQTINKFGITFYSDQDEADYESLYGVKTADHIKSTGYSS